MLEALIQSLAPRWSVVRFWIADLEQVRELDSTQSESGQGETGDPTVASTTTVVDLGVDANPETVVEVARAANLTATEAAERLARGSRCATLLSGDEPASTCWVSGKAEWLGELDGWFAPRPRDAYIWDCATRSVFRGRHFYPGLLREVLDRSMDQGLRRVWIATEIHNWRSARGVNHAGFRPVGIVVMGRCFGVRWRHVFGDPGAPMETVHDLEIGLSGPL